VPVLEAEVEYEVTLQVLGQIVKVKGKDLALKTLPVKRHEVIQASALKVINLVADAVSENGTDVGEAADVADEKGRTPLIWAAWYGHTEIVKRLLKLKVNLRAKTSYECTAGELSVGSRSVATVVKCGVRRLC
jgi:ankyrin repeat protein